MFSEQFLDNVGQIFDQGFGQIFDQILARVLTRVSGRDKNHNTLYRATRPQENNKKRQQIVTDICKTLKPTKPLNLLKDLYNLLKGPNPLINPNSVILDISCGENIQFLTRNPTFSSKTNNSGA